MEKEKKKLTALDISKIYAKWSRSYREEYHYESLGFLYEDLFKAGLSDDESRLFIYSVFLVDDWELSELIQKAQRYNDIQHAIDMGCDMGPMGDPYDDRF